MITDCTILAELAIVAAAETTDVARPSPPAPTMVGSSRDAGANTAAPGPIAAPRNAAR